MGILPPSLVAQVYIHNIILCTHTARPDRGKYRSRGVRLRRRCHRRAGVKTFWSECAGPVSPRCCCIAIYNCWSGDGDHGRVVQYAEESSGQTNTMLHYARAQTYYIRYYWYNVFADNIFVSICVA